MRKAWLHAQNRPGVSLVLVAVGMTAILGFGALAVDVGMIATAKAQAQRAAEAGALAGAAVVQAATVFTTADSTRAVLTADTFAERNWMLNSLVGQPGDSVQAELISALSRMRVTVTRQAIGLGFARALGFPTKRITARAAAAVMTAPASSCVQQFAVPDSAPYTPPDSGAIIHKIWEQQSDTLTIIGFNGDPPGVGNLEIGPQLNCSSGRIAINSNVPGKPGNTVTGPTRDGMISILCYDILNGITPLRYTPGVGFTRGGIPEPNWRSDARVANVVVYQPIPGGLTPGTNTLTVTGFINIFFEYEDVTNGKNVTRIDGTSIWDCNHNGGSNLVVYGRIFVAKGVGSGSTSSICDPTKAIPCVLKLVE